MVGRKRKHLSMKTKLAAALACLLSQDERDVYRRNRVSPETILRLFEFDHVALFALGGSDLWWNLDPKLKEPHREKSRRDTSVVAKVNRVLRAPAVVAGELKPKSGIRGNIAKKRTTGLPKRSWGIPGLRKKVNGDVVRQTWKMRKKSKIGYLQFQHERLS